MLAIGLSAVAGAVLVLWYLTFARYNRQLAARILGRVQMAWRGRVTGTRWAGSSQLYVGLQVPFSIFRRTRVTMRLLPRPVPTNWVLSVLRKQRETITFEADLDQAPSFNLEIHHHRWSGRSPKATRSQDWTLSHPGPIVLTTREDWDEDHNPMIHALLASRERAFLSVRFCPESPHFSATLPLESVPDQDAAAEVLGSLRELAAGARARGTSTP
jgi:hypothetical protein